MCFKKKKKKKKIHNQMINIIFLFVKKEKEHPFSPPRPPNGFFCPSYI